MYSWKIIYENIYLSVSYDFSMFDGSKKSRCDIPSGTTQGWACPIIIFTKLMLGNIF
jgi:hypothetical protein